MKISTILEWAIWAKLALVGGLIATGRALLVFAATRAARSLASENQIEERIRIFQIACGTSPSEQDVARAQKDEKKPVKRKSPTNVTNP